MNMKRSTLHPAFLIFGMFVFVLLSFKEEQKEPWTVQQLLAPADLAKTINNPDLHQPLILCVGPAAPIKNSIDIGPTRDQINQLQFKNHKLLNLPHNIKVDWIDHGYPVNN